MRINIQVQEVLGLMLTVEVLQHIYICIYTYSYWGYIGIMEKKMEATVIMGIIYDLHKGYRVYVGDILG